MIIKHILWLIQSLCVGISIGSASIFILIFNEQYRKKKIFTTVPLLSLSSMIAGFTTATFISIIYSFIDEKDNAM